MSKLKRFLKGALKGAIFGVCVALFLLTICGVYTLTVTLLTPYVSIGTATIFGVIAIMAFVGSIIVGVFSI